MYSTSNIVITPFASTGLLHSICMAVEFTTVALKTVSLPGTMYGGNMKYFGCNLYDYSKGLPPSGVIKVVTAAGPFRFWPLVANTEQLYTVCAKKPCKV